MVMNVVRKHYRPTVAKNFSHLQSKDNTIPCVETFKTALLEDPFWIYVALGLIEAILLLVWRARRTRRSAWTLVFPSAAAAVVLGISTLIATDREQIRSACDQIVAAVEDRDMRTAGSFLDEDFSGPYGPRADAILWVDTNVETHDVTTVMYKILDLEIRGEEASMRLRTWVTTRTYGRIPMDWRITWTRRGRGWLISSASEPDMPRPTGP